MNVMFKTAFFISGVLLLGKLSFSEFKTNHSLTNLKNLVKMDTLNNHITNKEAILDFYENILNKRKLERLNTLISKEYISVQGGRGVEEFKRQILELINAFPDAQWEVEEIVAEGNKVVVKQTIRGTQTGQFKNISPTNRAFTNDGIGIYEFSDGKIIRSQIQTDRLGFLQQLGVLPVDISAIAQEREHEEAVCLIDIFFIPESSFEEFTQRMNYNRNFIKNLPGFIKDEVYEKKEEKGNRTVITVAVWQSQDHVNNAKNVVQAEYKRIGFNPLEFYKRLNIKMERGLYQFYHENNGSR